MIIDFFIDLLNSLASALPSAPTSLIGSFEAIYEVFNLINYYIPVNEFFLCMTAYVVLINWKIGYKILKWLMERIVV